MTILQKDSHTDLVLTDDLYLRLKNSPPETPIPKKIAKKFMDRLLQEELKAKFPTKTNYTLWNAILSWRDKLNESDVRLSTKLMYYSSVNKMIEYKMVDPSAILQDIDDTWLQHTIKLINIYPISESSKKLKRAALRSLYRHVNEYDPDRRKTVKEYPPETRFIQSYLSADYVRKEAIERLNEDQWMDFFDISWKVSERDAMVMSVIWWTAMPLVECIKLKHKDLKRDEINRFFYIQFQDESVRVPECVINLLDYLTTNSEGDLFIVPSTGKRISRNQVVRTMKRVSKMMNLPFAITPKYLLKRAILIQRETRKNSFQRT